MMLLEQILQEQFDLQMYLPGMTFDSTEHLTRMERKYFITRLKKHFADRKAAEDEAQGKISMENFPQ